MNDAAFTVALIQMRSGVDMAANAAAAAALVEDAAARGAQLIMTPEGTNILERDPAKLANALSRGEDEESVVAMAKLAARRQVWLLAGSLIVSGAGARAANCAMVFSDAGEVIATYDKIHMFDVELGGGEAYRESASFAPGAKAVAAKTPFGLLGLTICYDVRFASLYRALAKAGAAMIAVPAAFTRKTGQAHWETLLRARAIETGSFILAPAQGGRHEDGRSTWGRSTIVNPWGEVIAKLDHDEPGVLLAEIDLREAAQARARIPALIHEREFAAP